jgi:hypothetical protein
MANHVFLLDLTKHNSGSDVQSLVDSVRRYTHDFKPTLVEWFLSPHQNMNADGDMVNKTPKYGPVLWRALEERIRRIARDMAGGAPVFHLLSYDGTILMSAAGCTSPEFAVTTLNLSAVARYTPQRTAVSPGAASTQLPLAEALQLAKSVLSQGGHTHQDNPLWLNRLRVLMTERDVRAAKDPSNPASERLIQSIVNDGLEKGWMRQTKRLGQTGSEQVWIVENTTAQESGPDLVASQGRPAAAESVQKDGGDVLTEEKFERTQEFVDCWKRRYIYCPKPIRDLLFQAIEDILGEEPQGLTVAKLTSTARQRAEKQCETFTYWQAATGGLANALVASQVLLTADRAPVPLGVECWGSQVALVSENFRDRCEAFMLYFVIKTLKNVNFYRDRIHLAHALLKEGPSGKSVDELMDRVSILMSSLGGRIEIGEDGLLSVRSVPALEIASSSAVA